MQQLAPMQHWQKSGAVLSCELTMTHPMFAPENSPVRFVIAKQALQRREKELLKELTSVRVSLEAIEERIVADREAIEKGTVKPTPPEETPLETAMGRVVAKMESSCLPEHEPDPKPN